MKSTIELTESNFEAEVLKSAQPVLVDFWAEWCGPCKSLAPTLEEIAREQAGRFKIGKVDVGTETNLAARYGIQAIPTLLYVSNGEVRQQAAGLVSKKVILENLERLAASSAGQGTCSSKAA